jgi:hypothetical protein
MSIPLEPDSPISTAPSAGHTSAAAGPAVRVLAFLAGLVLLIPGAFLSFGSVLAGAVGMGVVTLARHQRRQHLSRWGGWVASTVSVAMLLAVFAFIIAEKVPPGTWSQVQHVADSTAAISAKQPPPAWVERVFPGATARSAAQRRMFSPSTQSAFLFAGLGVAAAFYVALFGTLGWGAGMLLGLAVRGVWPGAVDGAAAVLDGPASQATSWT